MCLNPNITMNDSAEPYGKTDAISGLINCLTGAFLAISLSVLLSMPAGWAQNPQKGPEHGSERSGHQEHSPGAHQPQQEREEQHHHPDHEVSPAQQNQQQEQPEHTHQHRQIPVVQPETPRLGRAQQQIRGPVYRLPELERMALSKNPTLAQAAAGIASAKGRRLQSGLYPNPSLGYEGEEIRGGAFGGGEQGFFIQQSLITAGKLGLNRKIGDAEIRQAEAQAGEQRFRVLNEVRMAYYRVLSGQEMLETREDLRRISQEILKIANQLHNVGKSDDTEVLQAEIEAQRADVLVATQQNRLSRLWTGLAVAVGNSRLTAGRVEGSLEANLPQLNEDQLLESLLRESPEVRSAQAGFARAQTALVRARREPIPNIEFKAGLEQNNEPLEGARKVGIQGFAEVGIQLHIFDRNQGNVAAAKAEVEKARLELQRVDLSLRERFAAVAQNYRNARIVVERYHNEILPRSERAYELMVKRYGLMTASYPQVLSLQRTLYQTETGYIAALEELWMESILLQGFLLSGALEMPDKAGEATLKPMSVGVMPDRSNPIE
jgi:outer membrane protein, heavy metal efflux system